MAVPPWVATSPSDEVWNDEIRAGWEIAYTSVAGEYEYEISEIEGTIPADLKGSLWRNGPGNFERGGQRFEHVLDGDGYLGRISIDGSAGRASFKGRFVRTADFEEEEAADAILKRNTFGTQPEGGVLANAGRLALKNVANTNVVTLGGKVLALWEAGMPQRVVPSTMDCEGNDDLGGSLLEGGLVVSTGFESIDRLLGLGQGFTAHPRIDPASGRLAGFSWASKLDQSAVLATVREWDQASGRAAHATRVELAGSLAPHDFAITPSWYVFAHNAMALEVLPFVAGLKGPVECLKTTGGGVKLQLVPRPGLHAESAAALVAAALAAAPAAIYQESPTAPAASAAPATGAVPEPEGAFFQGVDTLVVETEDPYFNIHHATAFEEEGGRTVRLYTAGWPRVVPGPFLGDWGGAIPSYDEGKIAPTQLFETIIEMDGAGAARATKRVAVQACIDHPHVDPRFEGNARVRYVYMSYCNDEGVSGSPPMGWMRWDRHTGEQLKWVAPPGCFCEEVVLIPKQRRVDGGGAAEVAAEEDAADAWVAAMMLDSSRNASCLCILDAARIEAGPVAQLWLRHHVPHGLHGCWETGTQHGLD